MSLDIKHETMGGDPTDIFLNVLFSSEKSLSMAGGPAQFFLRFGLGDLG